MARGEKTAHDVVTDWRSAPPSRNIRIADRPVAGDLGADVPRPRRGGAQFRGLRDRSLSSSGSQAFASDSASKMACDAV
jgi:hypothetical protein